MAFRVVRFFPLFFPRMRGFSPPHRLVFYCVVVKKDPFSLFLSHCPIPLSRDCETGRVGFFCGGGGWVWFFCGFFFFFWFVFFFFFVFLGLGFGCFFFLVFGLLWGCLGFFGHLLCLSHCPNDFLNLTRGGIVPPKSSTLFPQEPPPFPFFSVFIPTFPSCPFLV